MARAAEPGGARWTALRTDDGSWTVRDEVVGESCHTTSGAWLEARERYAGPCRLGEPRPGTEREVRLLDVGTGLGLNLAAALEATATRGARLVATTLELERGLLELAAAGPAGGAPHPDSDPWMAPVREALCGLLAGLPPGSGPAPCGPVSVPMRLRGRKVGRLTLLLGDARETLRRAPGPFDAVFLDPFSPRRAPELWQPAFLAGIAARMAPGGLLSTYTVARPVRAALAGSGLRVRSGPPVGRKRAGTLAERTVPGPAGGAAGGAGRRGPGGGKTAPARGSGTPVD